MIAIDLGICRLRPLRPDDAADIARHADDRAVWAQLRDGFPHPYTLDHARGWLAAIATEADPADLAIEVDGRAAGAIGLARGPGSPAAELGYWLGRGYWGRGIATAAVRAVVARAFAGPGLDRIEACVFEGNPASSRVLEKAGFAVAGRSPCGSSKSGRVVGSMRYALDRAAFPAGSITGPAAPPGDTP